MKNNTQRRHRERSLAVIARTRHDGLAGTKQSVLINGDDRSPRPLGGLAMTLAVGLLAMTAGLMILPACSKKSPGPQSAATPAGKTMYHCPMHPQYRSDKPGDCPICSMRLVPLEKEGESVSEGERKILYYRNPMDPKVTSPVPAKDSMGMDYIPVYEGEEAQTTDVPGQASVKVSSARQQTIGVKVSTVEVRELFADVRASARVAYDPELYSAILEHQQTVKALKSLDPSAGPNLLSETAATVQASKLRVRQMGLSDKQIARMSESDIDPTNLLLGQPGGTVWVYADIYDYEASLVKPGHAADLTTPAYPGRAFRGTVKSIDPILNTATRTLRARIETPNPDGAFKPEMFLMAVIHASLGKRLAVPESAVMNTGTRQLVFVEREPGAYDPREVTLGRQAGNYYEVLGGLKEGERVVTSANFLIDSESKIKAAVSGK